MIAFHINFHKPLQLENPLNRNTQLCLFFCSLQLSFEMRVSQLNMKAKFGQMLPTDLCYRVFPFVAHCYPNPHLDESVLSDESIIVSLKLASGLKSPTSQSSVSLG